ncbi:MAG: Gmad2 immunoglobulin-like domain-containing protein [Actinobacteria bacterium]|nr:Gmad2 immunoglobulin-like domain-containing protein [Actinomycetota bacterium]
MRRARRAVVALLATVALAGCGGASDGEDASAPEPAPTVTVTVTETATPDDVEPREESPTPQPASSPSADPCTTPGLEGSAFIFVTSHQPGSTLASGDTVEGCANTFEATYEYELLDRDGAVLVEDFGTASCGTGCVGELSFTLDFSVPEQMVGTLRVFASSAEDGSETLVNAIPVLLQP